MKTYARLTCDEVQAILNSRNPEVKRIAKRMRDEGADGTFELEIAGPDEEELASSDEDEG